MDNEKDAVNIGVTLSTQLIAASLTMIAIVGTFAAFIIDKRDVGTVYYLIVGAAFFFLVISVILGGKGIDKARKNGFSGNWNLVDTKVFFNFQAFSILIGVMFFIISIFCGKEKADNIEKKLESQERIIFRLQSSDSIKRMKLIELSSKIDSIRKNRLSIKLLENKTKKSVNSSNKNKRKSK